MMALALMSVVSLAADPGNPLPATSEVSDTKTGSLLVYNIYTSAASGGNTQNTRVNITNVNLTSQSLVHLFFVSADCTIADSYICLSAAQTASFLASDVDPGVKGYILAVAVDNLGCPIRFNFLIGDEYVKFSSGHHANLGAEAFAAIIGADTPDTADDAITGIACNPGLPSVDVSFSGAAGGYNKLPRSLALSNFPSRADGNDTMLIVNSIAGNYATGATTSGGLFGVIYDDAETPFSYNLTGACQVMGSLSDGFPRTTPRLSQIVPAGRSGWLKIYNLTTDRALLGAAINNNANANAQANAFNGGHNLHKLTLTAGGTTITLPVFPPTC